MSKATDTTPATKRASYQEIKESGEDVPLRKRVAASIVLNPSTTSELAERFPEKSKNALRPRVNELLRMGCVEREGTRENPSGHEAYVHHITDRGERYLRGECDPDPTPPLSDLQGEVVDVARAVCADASTMDRLREVVRTHDGARLRRDPDWNPPHDLTRDTPGLTDEERERIKADPVLELEDFVGDGE